LAKILAEISKSEAFVGSAHSAETIKRKARERRGKWTLSSHCMKPSKMVQYGQLTKTIIAVRETKRSLNAFNHL